MRRYIACLFVLQAWTAIRAQTVKDLSGAALRQLVRATKQVTDEASKLALEQFRALHPSAATSQAPEELLQALLRHVTVSPQISRFMEMTIGRNFPELGPAGVEPEPGTLPVRLPILTVDSENIRTYTSNWSPKRILSVPDRMLCLIFRGDEATGAAILFRDEDTWKTEAFGSEKLAKPILENLRWDLPRQPDHEQYFVIHIPSVQRYYLARYQNQTIICVFGAAHNDLSIPTADVERLRDFLPKITLFLGKTQVLQKK